MSIYKIEFRAENAAFLKELNRMRKELKQLEELAQRAAKIGGAALPGGGYKPADKKAITALQKGAVSSSKAALYAQRRAAREAGRAAEASAMLARRLREVDLRAANAAQGFGAMAEKAAQTARASRQIAQSTEKAAESAKRAARQQIGFGKKAIATGLAAAALPGLGIFEEKRQQKSLSGLATLGFSPASLERINQESIQMSTQYGGLDSRAVTDAGYAIRSALPITEQSVIDYSKIATELALATSQSVNDADVRQISNVMSQAYGAYRRQFESDDAFIQEFSGAFSQTILRFRTDGQDLAAGMEALGASAANMGVSLADTFAIMAKSKEGMRSLNMSGTALGTMYKRLGNASQVLGIDFQQVNGKLLDFPEIIKRVEASTRGLSLIDRNDLLTEAFGIETLRFFENYFGKADQLKADIAAVNDAALAGHSMTLEMAKAGQTGQEFAVMRAQVKSLRIELAKGFAFTSDWAIAIGNAAARVEKWAKANPRLVATLSKITAVTVALMGGLGGLALIIGAVKLTMLTLAPVFVAIKGGIMLLAGAITSINAVLVANPFGLIVAGITAAVAAIVLIIRNWEKVKAALGSAWKWVEKKFTGDQTAEIKAIKEVQMQQQINASINQEIKGQLDVRLADDLELVEDEYPMPENTLKINLMD